MLWQMFICGRVADARDRPFFASQATKLLLIQKVEKPVDIIIASEGFLWPERQPGLSGRPKLVLRKFQSQDEDSDEEDTPTQPVHPAYMRLHSDNP